MNNLQSSQLLADNESINDNELVVEEVNELLKRERKAEKFYPGQAEAWPGGPIKLVDETVVGEMTAAQPFNESLDKADPTQSKLTTLV